MMYDCRPIRQNYYAHIAVLFFFLSSGALFASSGFVAYGAVTMRCVALALLLPAIQLIAKYMSARYLYRIREYESGEVDLEIYVYRGGDKMQLVSCVKAEEIEKIAPLGMENRKAPKGQKRYGYTPDLSPAKATVLSVTNEEGACEILFCPDAGMLSLLHEIVAKCPRKSEDGASKAQAE
jgi:hypothetical protein